jgi:YfiH family protein
MFSYRLENGKNQVWSGHSFLAGMGSFLSGIPSSFARISDVRELKQVHGKHVVDDEHYEGPAREGDGLLTRFPGVLLTIKTADCIPVFLVSPDRVGLIHAGWRGLKAGILEEALSLFHSSAPLTAVLGPSIFQSSYEVDRDLYESWSDPDLHRFLKPHRGTKQLLDLRGMAVHVLWRNGIPASSIHCVPLCTYRDHLPSYRRNADKSGRMVHYIYRISQSPQDSVIPNTYY